MVDFDVAVEPAPVLVAGTGPGVFVGPELEQELDWSHSVGPISDDVVELNF